jgi:hypothetical protein
MWCLLPPSPFIIHHRDDNRAVGCPDRHQPADGIADEEPPPARVGGRYHPAGLHHPHWTTAVDRTADRSTVVGTGQQQPASGRYTGTAVVEAVAAGAAASMAAHERRCIVMVTLG